MELKRVVVTGLGAITPLGNDVPSLGITIEFAHFLCVEVFQRIEVLDLTSKLSFEFRCIEKRNRPCSAYSF